MFTIPVARGARLVLGVALAAGLLAGARAAPVPDLYSARVPGGSAGAALDGAFTQALDEVVIKVTGQRGGAARGLLGSPAALVRQYQPLPGGLIRVEFDPVAVRRQLDAARLPVWGDDRPLTLVDVPLPVAPPADIAAPAGPTEASALEQLLLATAASRGVPIILPMAPAAGPERIEDLLAQPVAANPGGGVDAVLQGRPLATGGPGLYRWTLVLGDYREEWQGDGADGIHGLADRLAARYATAAAATRELRLLVQGVDSFPAYGQVQSYLRALDIIERTDIERVGAGGILFMLTVRGDPERLRTALALRPLLQEVDPLTAVLEAPTADLVYRLAANPR